MGEPNQIANNNEGLVTAKELARRLGVSEGFLSDQKHRVACAAVVVGARTRYRADAAVEAWRTYASMGEAEREKMRLGDRPTHATPDVPPPSWERAGALAADFLVTLVQRGREELADSRADARDPSGAIMRSATTAATHLLDRAYGAAQTTTINVTAAAGATAPLALPAAVLDKLSEAWAMLPQPADAVKDLPVKVVNALP